MNSRHVLPVRVGDAEATRGGRYVEEAHQSKIVGTRADLYKSQSVLHSTYTPQRKSAHTAMHTKSILFNSVSWYRASMSSPSPPPPHRTPLADSPCLSPC